MNYFVLLLLIFIGFIIYFVYARKNKAASKKELLAFLHVLSQSFHEAKWTQVGNKDVPPQVSALRMNKVLRTNLEYEFKSLLPKLSYFPRKGFVFPSEDQETNKFISKVFPLLRTSYERYKAKKSNLVSITDLFFKETEQLLLVDLEKEYTL
ncbi:MAG: hypothetical protein WAZ12_02230 [Candidatus Absconditicoccaceae bacterium]